MLAPSPIDCWDPNTWDLSPNPVRLYLDDYEQKYLLLDDIDYWHFCKWRWHINEPKTGRTGKKRYAVRSQGAGGRTKPRLYLHVELQKRTGILPPTPAHIIVDHRDGNEFNCCRSNLRWATPSMNAQNRMGSHQRDLFDV